MNIAVVIASTRRPTELARWAEHIRNQTLAPSRVIFAIARPEDLPPDFNVPGIEVIQAPLGLPAQRNTALNLLDDTTDLVAFYDDDFVPAAFSLEAMARLFSEHPEVVAASGHVVLDGIGSAGISYEVASSLVASLKPVAPEAVALVPIDGTYGCNMAFRFNAIGQERFDERLPLYGWLEDVDFSNRVGRNGAVVRTNAFMGVHQGVKLGRGPGRQFGYSQIANPLHLRGKQSIRADHAYQLMARNILMNHLRMFWPEPWIDRRGRAWGNWVALWHKLRGRLSPERVLEL